MPPVDAPIDELFRTARAGNGESIPDSLAQCTTVGHGSSTADWLAATQDLTERSLPASGDAGRCVTCRCSQPDGILHPGSSVLPGFRLHRILVFCVLAGMTPLAALQTVTLNPALALRATHLLGTVEAEKVADLAPLDVEQSAACR